MSDLFQKHRFDLEQIGDFIASNLEALGYDVNMDADMLRACLDSDNVEVNCDGQGFFIKKNGIVIANLPKSEIVNDKADAGMYPKTEKKDLARRIVVAV